MDHNGRVVRIQAAWEVPAGFFRGYAFRLLGRPGDCTVAESDSGSLELDEPLSGDLAGGAFELRSPEEAPVLAARLVTATPLGRELPPIAMRLATTRGTNALLERKGAATALFITRGFADLLLIGTQQRPDLFALRIEKPPPLYREVVEVPERLAADGSVLLPLDPGQLRAAVEELIAQGIESAAVALMHSYRNPRHEEEVGALLRDAGFRHVSLSSHLAPVIKLLPRAQTAVVDAYLSPVLKGYLEGVRGAVVRGSLHVMTSAGGLVRADSFHAKDSLLSGPAGGVVGASLSGRRAGFSRIIAFDMGGTSTDVARYDGDFEYLFEHRVGDAHLVAPALAVETVAAGGGSICGFDGAQLQVGPRSAGALPGPACYGAGGPLTLTDVNLILGRLDPERFEIPLNREAADRALEEILERMGGEAVSRETLSEGFLEIANERMAEAIRGISLRRGYDPAEYALVAFGGAGAQHACALAELLGIRNVAVPQDAGLLSALGLGAAVVERFAHRQILEPLARVQDQLPGWLDELGREAAAAVAAEGIPEAEIVVRRRILNLRFVGQDEALPIETHQGLESAFEAAYREIYGYAPEGRPIELESIRVVASSLEPQLDLVAGTAESAREHTAVPSGTRSCWTAGRWREVSVYDRSTLAAGARIEGPALVFESYSATVVSDAWQGKVDGARNLVLTRSQEIDSR
ncbi:MAG TPA: hydantoinase/oxoprolinase family protein [Thermoanaerobaculia bacterium]|nr:hydantoinase/oxoprolinase family protein [Thermoanaerobaculia bacterium]